MHRDRLWWASDVRDLISVGMELAYDGADFSARGPFGAWARPDLAHLARLMRRVVKHPEEAREVGRRARRDALAWSWERAAAISIGHIRELLAGRAPSARAMP